MALRRRGRRQLRQPIYPRVRRRPEPTRMVAPAETNDAAFPESGREKIEIFCLCRERNTTGTPRLAKVVSAQCDPLRSLADQGEVGEMSTANEGVPSSSRNSQPDVRTPNPHDDAGVRRRIKHQRD